MVPRGWALSGVQRAAPITKLSLFPQPHSFTLTVWGLLGPL